MAFTVEVITLLPELWPPLVGRGGGLVGRAFADGLATLHVCDLRQYGRGVHHQVDDAPYGGGPGMVLRVEPLHQAILAARARTLGEVLLLSPRGEPFSQARARQLAMGPGMVLVCGRYEGVDERVRRYVDAELSVGDFVLSGGDPAAWAVIDAVVRLQPQVLGNAESPLQESFTGPALEYPHYTRPVEYDGARVPDVLLSGNHANIERWREAEAEHITRERRPDLLGAGI